MHVMALMGMMFYSWNWIAFSSFGGFIAMEVLFLFKIQGTL